ncbi:hypothetical protein L596_022509 [Steinernema carpocapsae]|uniref:Uncharacterized protein n=1 Tax=Steinernema carpocapsae TaxID=34508 RepID=A0A4U5MLW4_STECR|nr:hypothetical protein L596_022509 [Steinernema carpocapsae]
MTAPPVSVPRTCGDAKGDPRHRLHCFHRSAPLGRASLFDISTSLSSECHSLGCYRQACVSSERKRTCF